MKVLVFIFSIIITLVYACDISANTDNQFVTIVNPVRVAPYTTNPEKSISEQYKVVQESGLPASWLLTYDALNNIAVVDVTKNMNSLQEIGVFLEVTPNLAELSKVDYKQDSSWHHANAIFLSGYTQEDRKKLIDTIFTSFFEKYGYYPKSVGSWWTDSYSLSYMKDKYGIITNLTCADQFSTDGYQIWGTYWSTPYYPTFIHTGIPADKNSKINVVNIQWAHRDPIDGYYSSLYSTQDYFVNPVNQEIDYFKELVNLYSNKGQNSFGHITVGLESDLDPNVYSGIYKDQIKVIEDLSKSKAVKVLTMNDFGDWYKNNFEDTPQHIIYKKNHDTNTEILWYQSSKYRIGIQNKDNKSSVIDFRVYDPDLQEPYYVTPNGEHKLYINIPSIIDTLSSKNDVWEISEGVWNLDEKNKILEIGDSKIDFNEDKILISNLQHEIPRDITDNEQIEVSLINKTYNISRNKNSQLANSQFSFRSIDNNFYNNIYSKKYISILIVVSLITISLFYKVIYLKSSLIKKTTLFVLLVGLITLSIWLVYLNNSKVYYVSQAELDTLNRLSIMQEGTILLYDNECIGCTWQTKYMPAVYANKREYVSKVSGKKSIKNKSVFDAKSQQIAKEEFDKLNVDYIYVAKYGTYIEKPPFSPGDLNIELIYANANSELWRVKK